MVCVRLYRITVPCTSLWSCCSNRHSPAATSMAWQLSRWMTELADYHIKGSDRRSGPATEAERVVVVRLRSELQRSTENVRIGSYGL